MLNRSICDIPIGGSKIPRLPFGQQLSNPFLLKIGSILNENDLKAGYDGYRVNDDGVIEKTLVDTEAGESPKVLGKDFMPIDNPGRSVKKAFSDSLGEIKDSWYGRKAGYNIPVSLQHLTSKFTSNRGIPAFFNAYHLYKRAKITPIEFEKYVTQYMNNCLKGLIRSFPIPIYSHDDFKLPELRRSTRKSNTLFENDFFRAILQWGIETQGVSRKKLPEDDKFQEFYDQVKGGEDTGVGGVYNEIIQTLALSDDILRPHSS